MAPQPSMDVTVARTPRDARRSRRLTMTVLASLVSLAIASVAAAGAILGTPNAGHLVAVGPTSGDNGFPVWFKDDKGMRLEPCLDVTDPDCGALAKTLPNSAKPVSFPDNFPGEFFYQLAQATQLLPGGGKAIGDFNLEGSFSVPTTPMAGQQITFGRLRIRIDGLKVG